MCHSGGSDGEVPDPSSLLNSSVPATSGGTASHTWLHGVRDLRCSIHAFACHSPPEGTKARRHSGAARLCPTLYEIASAPDHRRDVLPRGPAGLSLGLLTRGGAAASMVSERPQSVFASQRDDRDPTRARAIGSQPPPRPILGGNRRDIQRIANRDLTDILSGMSKLGISVIPALPQGGALLIGPPGTRGWRRSSFRIAA